MWRDSCKHQNDQSNMFTSQQRFNHFLRVPEDIRMALRREDPQRHQKSSCWKKKKNINGWFLLRKMRQKRPKKGNSPIIPLRHIHRLILLRCDLFEPINELVNIFLNQRFLFLQSFVAECVREQSSALGVVFVIVEQNRGDAVDG